VSAAQPAAAAPARERRRSDALVVAAAALAVRAAAVALSDRVVADVLRYHRLATHILDVSWNPYLAPRLYPYAPAWVWVEAGAEWAARHAGVPFALAVKAPVVLADAVLAGLIAHWAASRRVGWAYALHPVAVLVVGFHGQFDSVALLALAYALHTLERGRLDTSALVLAAAIAVKPFPVFVLPFALVFVPGSAARFRYAALATLPVALLLVPFAWADMGALRRELFAYGGIADFGWIGAWRAVQAVLGGHVARSEAVHWATAVTLSKLAFPAAAGGLWAAVVTRRLRWSVEQCALGVLLAFEASYGALSAQYLLWPVPLAVLLRERWTPVHAAVATVALVGFYVLLAPGVLTPPESPLVGTAVAAWLWAAGTVALWTVTVAWLVALVRRGLRPA
jgi:hypothetical protein